MFITYDDRGFITGTMSGPHPKDYGPILSEHGVKWLFNAELEEVPIGWSHYVDVTIGEVKVRPPMPIVVTGVKVSGIPSGCLVTVKHDEQEVLKETVTDGVVELDAATSGTYKLEFVCWPFVDTSVEIKL